MTSARIPPAEPPCDATIADAVSRVMPIGTVCRVFRQYMKKTGRECGPSIVELRIVELRCAQISSWLAQWLSVQTG